MISMIITAKIRMIIYITPNVRDVRDCRDITDTQSIVKTKADIKQDVQNSMEVEKGKPLVKIFQFYYHGK